MECTCEWPDIGGENLAEAGCDMYWLTWLLIVCDCSCEYRYLFWLPPDTLALISPSKPF